MAACSRRSLFDAHHHLWQRASTPRSGILGAPYLNRDFAWADLADAFGEAVVEGTCMVEALEDPGEVNLAEGVSAQHPALRSMVAYAPVEKPSIGTELTRLAQHPIVRGVRRSTQNEADPAFVLRSDFVAGGRVAGERGFHLELCVRHGQLAAVPGLAELCPDTVIVVQHLGKPDVTMAPTSDWLRAMDALGRCDNVWCKVSPVVHAASDPPFTVERLAPFIRHAVASFGWSRVLFGSNWPVSTAVTTCGGWISLVEQSLPTAGASDLEALFHTNGERLYTRQVL